MNVLHLPAAIICTDNEICTDIYVCMHTPTQLNARILMWSHCGVFCGLTAVQYRVLTNVASNVLQAVRKINVVQLVVAPL